MPLNQKMHLRTVKKVFRSFGTKKRWNKWGIFSTDRVDR